MIGLKIDIPENYRAGITYKTNDGKKYGISSHESNETDTLLLKMFITENQNPDNAPLAWELKLKNVYRLPAKSIFEDGFVFNIYYDSSGALVKNIPDNLGNPKSIMTITNLDRYTGNTQNPPPDGVFDFLPGLTIDTASGDIIFPSLKPFYEDLSDANINPSYYFSELYTQAKGRAQGAANANAYFLKGYFESVNISQ
jgi:cell surface protein SprA